MHRNFIMMITTVLNVSSLLLICLMEYLHKYGRLYEYGEVRLNHLMQIFVVSILIFDILLMGYSLYKKQKKILIVLMLFLLIEGFMIGIDANPTSTADVFNPEISQVEGDFIIIYDNGNEVKIFCTRSELEFIERTKDSFAYVSLVYRYTKMNPGHGILEDIMIVAK